MTDTDTTAEQPPSPDTPELPLDAKLLALRDHISSAFPAVEALGQRGELTLLTTANGLIDLLGACRDDPAIGCEMLADVSAVHWPAGTHAETSQETTGWPSYTETREQGIIEVDYILRSLRHGHWFRIRVAVPDDAAALPSATGLYSSASFMEREAFDLMGITFTGHPALTRIMMPEDWDGHPHRKDYPLGGVEVMYKGQTVPPPDERDY